MAAKIKSPTLPSLEFFDTYSHYKQKLCHRKNQTDKNLTETNKNKSSWPENSNMKLMKSKAIQNMASIAHKTTNKSHENNKNNNNTRRHSIAGCHDEKLEGNEMIDEGRDRGASGRGGMEKSPGVMNRTNLSYSKPNTRIGFRNTANRRRRSVANRSNSFFTSRNSINHFYQEIKGFLGFYHLRIGFFPTYLVSKSSHQKLHRQN